MNGSPTQDRRSLPLVRAARAVFFLCFVGLLVDAFLLKGLWLPLVVDSGSMAPAYVGPHRLAHCQRCQFEFPCGAEFLPSDGRATCPNCGYGEIDLAAAPARSGDRLLVDRTAFLFHLPQRWQPIVFHDRDGSGGLSVKRVVGLPGETLAVRGGDVFVNGQIARKSLADQLRMATVVHDTRFSSADNTAKRWRPETAASGWSEAGRKIVWSPEIARDKPPENSPPQDAAAKKSEQPPTDWLSYRHLQSVRGWPAQSGPVLDDATYNQSESRTLSEVSDLALRCRLRMAGSGSLWLRAYAGAQRFEARIDAVSGEVRLAGVGRSVSQSSSARPLTSRSVEIVLSLIDQQVLLAIDGQTLIFDAFEAPSQEGTAAKSPFSLAAQDLQLEIEQLEVLRDIYYTSLMPGDGAASYVLAADEVFVLGDNSPQSLDSRNWSGQPGLQLVRMIGKPLKISGWPRR